MYSIGSYNTALGLEMKLLNVSKNNDKNSELTKLFERRIFLSFKLMEEYFDFVELDPLGNIYNRKSFKEIFNELGTPKNN